MMYSIRCFSSMAHNIFAMILFSELSKNDTKASDVFDIQSIDLSLRTNLVSRIYTLACRLMTFRIGFVSEGYIVGTKLAGSDIVTTGEGDIVR